MVATIPILLDYGLCAIFFLIVYFLAQKFICKKKEHGIIFKLWCVVNIAGSIIMGILGVMDIFNNENLTFIEQVLLALIFWLFVLAICGTIYFLYKWKKEAYYTLILIAVFSAIFDYLTGIPDASIAGIAISFGLVFGAKSKFLDKQSPAKKEGKKK